MVEYLEDLEINQNRQVHVDTDTNDLATTEGVRTVEQSAAIHAGDVLRPLIGEPVTDERLDRIERRLTDALQSDPQLEEVVRVNVQEVNRDTGELKARAVTRFNDDFQLTIPL